MPGRMLGWIRIQSEHLGLESLSLGNDSVGYEYGFFSKVASGSGINPLGSATLIIINRVLRIAESSIVPRKVSLGTSPICPNTCPQTHPDNEISPQIST